MAHASRQTNESNQHKRRESAHGSLAPLFWCALVALALISVVALRYRQMQQSQAQAEAAEAAKKPPAAKINRTAAPGPAPDGMVWVPGGTFWMGHGEYQDAPEHLVEVAGFWADAHEVTNDEFAKFVEATGYQTIAEQPLDPKEFPQVPPEDLKPGSIVFSPPNGPVPLNNHLQWWKYVPGANWRQPEGPGSTIEGRENHPVVQIAWPDAVAYAKWAGKRLPTEAEWEFAARGGLDRAEYCWGNELRHGADWRSNIWQGEFPAENTEGDRFRGTAPVASFAPNGYGLYDVSGNVWEWCADWYQPDYYTYAPRKNPQGPDSSFDPAEPGIAKRVQKGGSFMCADSYCRRYVPGARGKGDPNSAAVHIGFRCVK
jgi:formylglycine-generating enzyme required for sulfatase activity